MFCVQRPGQGHLKSLYLTIHFMNGAFEIVFCFLKDDDVAQDFISFCYSKQAVFDGKRAIRGGIPFVFPQFGQWAFGPQHGFARVARWHVEKMPERLPSGDVEAVFSLMDDEFTHSMWHFQFRLTYRLILREKELHFNIGVYNPSKELTFSCQLLLHTYFKVPDVRRCQITGMHGCMFIDKTREGAVYQETREVVTINEWTDRIYQNTMQEHIITNVVSGRKMRIQKYNFPDTGELCTIFYFGFGKINNTS
ncbi:jg13140 [Pararge aegeria aegeria]|uniref:Galactose mutarotase n=1 Tax=Pararge aegeria aegeria TaxID=348720 RepID=A0A8S4RRR4_9NEOP|nr:jg13140 [Pararge aegeria aegeria]